MQKNILVTGGLGFIGSHLVQQLIRGGHRITILDNESSNAVPPYSFIHDAKYRFCSISSTALDELAPQDEVYHLASPVGPAGVLQHAGQIIRQVCDSTYAVMDAALRWGAKLVDVSTSELYGQQSGFCSEDMPRVIQAETTVRLEYAVAKLAMETALINTARVSNLQAVIVRPFNVAGPRQSKHGGFVLPRFVEQALNNEALTVFWEWRTDSRLHPCGGYCRWTDTGNGAGGIRGSVQPGQPSQPHDH
jgi:UDP-glucose 4-epimerase